MKTINIQQLAKKCETCDGTTMLMWTGNDAMKGMVKPCPDCIFDYKKSANLYGTDIEDLPDVYVDAEKGVLQKVKKDQKSVVIDGIEYEL